MKKLHIIGGSGFFGSSFIEKEGIDLLYKFKINELILSARNFKKINKETKLYLQKKKIIFRFLKLDITSCEELPFSDYIIYSATSSLKKKYTNNLSREIENSNRGVINLLKILKQKKFRDTKIIFTSSGAVYGKNNHKKKLNEETKILSKNLKKLSLEKFFYATSKIKAEKKFINFSNKFKNQVFICRCFAFIGKSLYLNQHFVIGNIIQSIIKKKKITLNSLNSSEIYRSFMNTNDLVHCFLKILTVNKKKRVDIINVGSDEIYSLKILSIKLNKIFGKFITFQDKINSDIDFYIPNINKLKNVYDFNPKKKLIYSIKKIINSYK